LGPSERKKRSFTWRIETAPQPQTIVRASKKAKVAARARGITEITKASGITRVEAFITYFGINTTSRSLPGIDHRPPAANNAAVSRVATAMPLADAIAAIIPSAIAMHSLQPGSTDRGRSG